MVENHYKSKPAFGLYDKVIEMERWFQEDKPKISALQNHNTPLVIVGPDGSGRTTLLFQWIQFHEAKSQFFTNITLFDLNQRIEMQGDKIRTFFYRWLELADAKKKQMTTQKCKIILVIDGIDRQEIESNSYQGTGISQQINNKVNYKTEEESPDWMPQSFPEEFRVIITCKKNSKSYNHFKNMKVPFRFLNVPQMSQKVIEEVVESYFDTISTNYSEQEIQDSKEQIFTFISNNPTQFQNHLYLHTFLNIYFPSQINLKLHKLDSISLNILAQSISTEELFKTALKHYETKFLPRSKFRKISSILAMSKTGMKKEELKECIEVKPEMIDLYLKLFGFALFEHRQQIRVSNEIFKSTIEKLYLQEELFKNEIHSSIVTILSKVKHFNSNARLIEEVTYNIFKQGNQWLRLKDLLSNLEIFCHMYKPADKYTLATYWQKLEQHGFDPVYEYNKTVEAFVLNYFPTQSELFVILTQFARFFKELGDLETRCTPEFRHPPLVISPELENIRLNRELDQIGGMLIETKNNLTLAQEEQYNVENPLFMQVYREKQVDLLNKENPLFPVLQLYYYKRWIWLQFPWFCMDINSSFSTYMNRTMGKSINLHMNTKNEMDFVKGSLRIIKEAKSRKQLSGKQQIYQVPQEFALEEFEIIQDSQNDEKGSSSDESVVSRTSRGNQTYRSVMMQRNQRNQSVPASPKNDVDGDNFDSPNRDSQIVKTAGRARFQMKPVLSQSRLSTAGPVPFGHQRNSLMGESKGQGYETMSGMFTGRRSQYSIAKSKWIDQDYELANLKGRIKPENAVRVVSNQIKNYERKELQTVIQINRELVNETNRIAFEIQQKEKIFKSLQNCIFQLDNNNKETQAFEKRLQQIQDKLDSTRYQYKVSKKEQNRLRHIVNYCFKNKADNHEWINGLEMAVKNMITLIKHEKEQMITSKNLVLDLKKSSKELSSLKTERKMLQQMTTDTMYGMISEKQTIKGMREEFERRKDAAFHRDDDLEQSHFKSAFLDGQNSISSQSVNSPHRIPTKMDLYTTNRRNQFQKPSTSNLDIVRSNDNLQMQNGMSKEQVQGLISKLEQIRVVAGAKEIEDIQQMIDFLTSHQQLLQQRSEKEDKVFKLRQQKQDLLKDLQQFHNTDIDISNARYQPKKLQNNIQRDITQQELERNLKRSVFDKQFGLFISTRVLIEEMKKRLRLDTTMFKKQHTQIKGNELVEALEEIADFVDSRRKIVEEIFGQQSFHDTMVSISQIDAKELRMKLLQHHSSRGRNQQLPSKHQEPQNHEMKTHDGIVNHEHTNINEKDDNQKRVMLQTTAKKSKYLTNDYLSTQFNGERKSKVEIGILIEDMDHNYAKSNTEQTYSVAGNSFRTDQRKHLIKRNSKVFSQDPLNKFNSSQKTVKTTTQQQSEQLLSQYHTPRAIIQEESSYMQSISNMGKPLKEKELLFFRRVQELEKGQDVVQQTIQAMVDFRRQADHSLEDDSYQQLEQQRNKAKQKDDKSNIEIEAKDKRRFTMTTRAKSTANFGPRNKLKEQINLPRSPEFHRPFQDQDEEPIIDYNLAQDLQEQRSAMGSANLTHRHQRNHTSNSNVLEAFIRDEQVKLPTYAKQIFTQNNKDLIKRLKLMNSNIQKYDRDEMMKKLMSQTERFNKKQGFRFAHQQL